MAQAISYEKLRRVSKALVPLLKRAQRRTPRHWRPQLCSAIVTRAEPRLASAAWIGLGLPAQRCREPQDWTTQSNRCGGAEAEKTWRRLGACVGGASGPTGNCAGNMSLLGPGPETYPLAQPVRAAPYSRRPFAMTAIMRPCKPPPSPPSDASSFLPRPGAGSTPPRGGACPSP